MRWQDVDLDRGQLRVEQSLEQTSAGLRFKAPKTRHGRRLIALPPSAVAELRAHWKAQQEQRMALGMGRAAPSDLVFATWEGKPRSPNALTKEWSVAMDALGLPHVTLHSLAAHARFPTDRRGGGHLDGEPAPRAWIARDHADGLRAHVCEHGR